MRGVAGPAEADEIKQKRIGGGCNPSHRCRAEDTIGQWSRRKSVEADVVGLPASDEFLGAIFDDAFKWARASVSVMTATEQTIALITVDDDGPAIKDGRIADVVRPGVRLDQTVLGYGFGLSIAKELTEIYGGSLTLGEAPSGGLRVEIRLSWVPV